MNQTPIPFLQRIQNEAPENGYTSLDLPQQQGVVVLPQNTSSQEQIQLLQQLILQLDSTPQAPARMADIPVSVQQQDCQVTVEERAQLFKALSST